MTQMQEARAGRITPAMEMAAQREGLTAEFIRQGLASGTIVLPANINHKNLEPCAIGHGLRTKVNANIGTSPEFPDLDKEIEKLEAALAAGVDAVMDLSTGGDLNVIRREILKRCTVPVGTVAEYQAMVEARRKYGNLIEMTEEDLFNTIEQQARDGADFITVHCGVTGEGIERLKNEGRITDIVSRGGAFMAGWILHHNRENPLYEQYDRLLDIAEKYDVTLSLGDGLRPGCLADASDRAQIHELIILGELVDRAWERGIQVMVEGPGHVPLNQIEANVILQKRICKGAPFYVLGPLVTDVAPGYDHITSAIGGAIAASAGVDFLCYVTPAEHLGLPSVDDVREGVMASRIAAHAADIVKGAPGALAWDLEMAKARKALDWQKQIELAIDWEKAARYWQEKNIKEKDENKGKEECSMCGEFCAMKVIGEHLQCDRNKKS
ncbi:phosphomethylpyrimidine synthase ThiC [Thermincola potens]|uniref:Phosphomethylpyrimidine synthase n=1 Tax=Thermincola potens (strain JR) TaxID=635013 RepID=D5XCG6_THEPJ|nr:phosphomethylpyrimidine synthase ThiC [Thermincola potens]ADG81592.1 thiamine biosynthesis protein ThiC [Thermincola potens JR]